MSYCDTKVRACKVEYDRVFQEKLEVQRERDSARGEAARARRNIKENVAYKAECTQLRAALGTVRQKGKDTQRKLEEHRKKMKALRSKLETQKQRLNDSSKSIAKLNRDLG